MGGEAGEETCGGVTLQWLGGLVGCSGSEGSVLVVGRATVLPQLSYEQLSPALPPAATKTVWEAGVRAACGGGVGEVTEAAPGALSLAVLGSPASAPPPARHSPPSAHFQLHRLLEKRARTYTTIILVCDKRDVLPWCLAVSRAHPQYSARTQSAGGGGGTVQVRVVLAAQPEPEAARERAVWAWAREWEVRAGPSGAGGELAAPELAGLAALCASVRRAQRLADMPANFCTVDHMLQEAGKVCKEVGGELWTARGEELKALGLGGIYGVGRAATCPPALAVLSWAGADGSGDEVVALVGKGIVYDTGGLCIKTRAGMMGMKRDMAGAAAVLGAFAALVRARPAFKLHALLCLAENAVGPLATRPGDIHTLHSGRTVEINNTDAEGRLVLGDGVSWAARELHATTIIDMATLTGAQGIATGKYHAAAVTNCEELEAWCVQAGHASGDLVHALPYAPDLHMPELNSALADMKNSVQDRSNAQPSCAGLFIMAQLGFDWPHRWLHLDMAAPAYYGERCTGWGVALLCVLLGARTGCPLLQKLAPPLTPAPSAAPPNDTSCPSVPPAKRTRAR